MEPGATHEFGQFRCLVAMDRGSIRLAESSTVMPTLRQNNEKTHKIYVPKSDDLRSMTEDEGATILRYPERQS